MAMKESDKLPILGGFTIEDKTKRILELLDMQELTKRELADRLRMGRAHIATSLKLEARHRVLDHILKNLFDWANRCEKCDVIVPKHYSFCRVCGEAEFESEEMTGEQRYVADNSQLFEI